MSGQYVVILTGGARPGDEISHIGPATHQIDLAVERGTNPNAALMARHVAEEGFLLGYAEAAKLQRIVTAWVVDDRGEAKRFAEFVTREIDPAFVLPARSALGEMLAAANEARRSSPEVPF